MTGSAARLSQINSARSNPDRHDGLPLRPAEQASLLDLERIGVKLRGQERELVGFVFQVLPGEAPLLLALLAGQAELLPRRR
jgi:hypothetical protein